MLNRILFPLICLLMLSSVGLCKDLINFTEEEKEWIKNHPVIRVENELNAAPFDFNESGKAKGLSIDYIKLLAQKTGLKIEFIYGHTWDELLELFKQGKIDVMPSFFKNKEREHFTLYTEPYLEAKLAVFIRADDKNFKNKDIINKKIGILKSHGAIPYIKEKLTNIDLIELENQTKLIQRLATEKLDAVIENPFIMYYFAQINQIDNIRLWDYIEMDEEQQGKTSMHIGVRYDLPILHQILVKAVDAVSDEEMLQIKKKWTTISIVRIDWTPVVQLLGAIVLVVIFLLWNNRILKSLVKAKTQELQKLNETLELKVKLRTKELLRLNNELALIANTDPLTNTHNRRFFFDVSKQIVSLSKRDQLNLSVAMIDIDKFKNINDTHGHDVGDKVIQSLVKELNRTIRNSDVLARFGGEEFVILFPNTGLEGALITSEKIRKIIANCSTVDKISFTISIGVSEFFKAEQNIDATIKRADKALYKAKNGGRNRVEYV